MKVILYDVTNDNEDREIAFWYAKEFIQPGESACIIAVPYGDNPEYSTEYYKGNNPVERLFSFLNQRDIDPNQCDFHFMLQKRKGISLPLFTNDAGGRAQYGCLFDQKDFKGKVYAGVRSPDEKAIVTDLIKNKNQLLDFNLISGATQDAEKRRELPSFQIFRSLPQSTTIVEYSIKKSRMQEIDDLIQAKITKLSTNVLKQSSTEIIKALEVLRDALNKDQAQHPSAVIADWKAKYNILLNQERTWLASVTTQTNLKAFIELLERSYPPAGLSAEYRLRMILGSDLFSLQVMLKIRMNLQAEEMRPQCPPAVNLKQVIIKKPYIRLID